MADLSPQDVANKLLSSGFGRKGPVASSLSDPIADTPMVVTLDELRPYELDPRLTRNPRFDDIKASIRERGLDAPPPITRRPGADHFIIRNGGNTRLAILRELWTETRDERFFRVVCLFRPWPERGEIIALTGHLAENELHGGLSFIERALGVQKARDLYEQETGKPLSQSELARRLKADGYPVPQPHISRMQEAIQYLLPAIPTVLYAGLGRPQVEQLTSLRRAADKVWSARSRGADTNIDFPTLFQDVLTVFDGSAGGFSIQRVQDELLGQMADQLGVEYDTLAFEVADSAQRWQALSSDPAVPSAPATSPAPAQPVAPHTQAAPAPKAPPPTAIPTATIAGAPTSDAGDEQQAARLQENIVSPVGTTERLQAIQRLVADHVGETVPDFGHRVLQSIPIQAGGLYPITDIWYIEPGLDEPERLRTHIAQFAREIAGELGLQALIEDCQDGIGFRCLRPDGELNRLAQATLALLHALSAPYLSKGHHVADVDLSILAESLGTLLQGRVPQDDVPDRLSDNALVKLFRLLRLARRLRDTGAGSVNADRATAGS